MNIEVFSVSKYNQDISKAPATIIVITKEQIINRGYFDLSDILKDMPGIDLVDNARGFGEFYTIRGIEGNDRFIVLVDGQKVNPESGTFLSVGNSLSVRFANRVEIIYGPASAVYGADAFAGIINIISEDIPDKSQINAYANYGSLNSLDGAINAQFKINDNLSFSATARYYQSNGPNFVGKDTIYDAVHRYPPPLKKQFEQPIYDHNIFLNAKYKDFTLSYFRQHFNEGNALGTNPKDMIYNKEDKWELSTNILWAKYVKEFGKGRSLKVNLAYANHTQNPETQFFKTKSPYEFDNTFSQYMTGIDNTIRTEVSFSNTINSKLQFVVGIELKYTSSVPPYANDEVLGESIKYEGNNADIIKDSLTITEHRAAAFAQFTYNPIEAISFIIGGRYDYSSRYSGSFNPRIGLIATPFSKTTVKATFGTAFQAPSLFYQYEQWGSANAVMLSVDELKQSDPEWNLNDQEIQTFELGISQQIGKIFYLNITGYKHLLSNLIERVMYTDQAFNKYASNNDTTIYSPGFRNENAGKQDIIGVDVRINSEISKNFSAYLYYSYIDAKADNNGVKENIPRIADHKIWFGFSINKLLKYITITPELKWVGEISNRNKFVFPNGKQPGYTIVDLNIIAYNLIPKTRLYIHINNLLNSNFEYSGLYNQVSYLPTIQQMGFNAIAGIEVNF